jgi:hypothetical protein
MDKREFDTLVKNIRNDGCLTSLPIIYDNDIPGEILSGNHRVKAAIKAEIDIAECIVIKSTLSESQKIGIQLSHNSIHGKDDPNLLKDLYDSISSLDIKEYSGLTDDSFKVSEIKLVPLSFEREETHDVMLSFLTSDKKVFEENKERIIKYAANFEVLTAEINDFEAFSEAMFKVKTKFNIINSALAIKMLSQLANERLDQLLDITGTGEDKK